MLLHKQKNDAAREAYNIGTSLMQANEFDAAENYLLQAIKLDPNYVDAMDHLGLVYRNQKRYIEAEKIYLRSIEIMPNNSVPYINLAFVYKLDNKLEEARQIYLKFIKINENDPEGYYGIGQLYQMVGQYENSIYYFDIAIQKYIDSNSNLVFDALYQQGNNYYNLKQYETALQCYQNALKTHPNDMYLLEKIEELSKK
jgi:tetratricopeptide (TPR) repeat protein